jgi:ribosomal protein L12E/L44/L45/RPP1/RPP2
MKYKAKVSGSVTVMVDGANVPVVLVAGESLDLEEVVADLVNNDVPGALAPVKETKAGTTKAKASATRQKKAEANRG